MRICGRRQSRFSASCLWRPEHMMSATCFPLLAAAGDIAPTADKSVLSLPQFEEKLRHVGRFGASALLQNPLEAAVGQINGGPALTQSRLLRRVLQALCATQGEFRYAE